MEKEEVMDIEMVSEEDENVSVELVPVKNWIDGKTYWMTEEEAEIYYRNAV